MASDFTMIYGEFQGKVRAKYQVFYLEQLTMKIIIETSMLCTLPSNLLFNSTTLFFNMITLHYIKKKIPAWNKYIFAIKKWQMHYCKDVKN